MAEDIANEIQQMLKEAWGNFCDYHKKYAPEYPKLWEFNEKKAKESHWICWNEYDLMFHIGRHFYDILRKKKEDIYSNIEMHFEKNVNRNNFEDYEFEDRLGKLNKILNMKRGPKIDLIIAYESRNRPFLLCAEVKCFHSPAERYYKTAIDKIREDIEKLKAIREYKIAQSVAFMLFDDYYWCTKGNEEKANNIKHELERIEKEEGILVLPFTSEAKLEKYKQPMWVQT